MTQPHASETRLPPIVAVTLLVLVALALRIGVVAAIPNFFGSGDPSVYYSAARGCLRHGVPRIDFVWHFLTAPPAISHLEDYCEPGFAYLLAIPLALFGGGVWAAKLLSVACGTLAAVAVYRFTRRFGRPMALLAAALVAFEPWSIYYGGLIMKEATVSLVVVLFLDAARRLLAAEAAAPRAAVGLGLLTVAAGCVQYELLSILATATAVTLGLERRRQVWPYLAGVTAAGLALLAITWAFLGVPISAKLQYFIGRSLWDPIGAAGPLDPAGLVALLLPGRTLLAGLADWYPVLLALAILGARDPRVSRSESRLLAAFGFSYFYFHAVPGDVWPRDIVPATAAFAPYAALGIGAVRGWLMRAWAPAVTIALLVYPLAAPHAYGLAARLTPEVAGASNWAAAAVLAGAVGLPMMALLAVRRRLPFTRVRPVLPALLALALALNYHASLPWPAIYGNPQMPGYELQRARRERVGKGIRGILAGAPVMATAPGEVSLYAGAPSVLLPGSAAGIRLIRARYRVAYLLVGQGILRPGVVEALPVVPILEVEDYTLFRFTAD